MALTLLEPIVVNTAASFTFANVSATSNLTAGNVKTDNLLYANGSPYVVSAAAGGANTQVQFNDANTFAGSANFTFTKTTNTLSVTNITANGAGLTALNGSNVTGQVANALIAGTVYTAAQPNITSVGTLNSVTSVGTINFTGASNVSLGAVGNVKITGGTSGYVLSTDGAGTLSWVAQSGGSSSGISNGTSNVNIPSANGNVNISSAGNANVVVITGTGVNVAGTLSATGNANVGNIGATNGVFTNVSGNGSALSSLTGGNITGQVANALVAGTVYTAAQPNITSVGTLSNLTSNGTINFINASNVSLGAVGNVKITGGTSGYVLSTDGVGNLSWVAQTGGGGGGSSIANGTSNVDIPTANGNVNISSAGNANVVVITGTGMNVTGNIVGGSGTGGSITGANLVSANYFTGTLTTGAQPNITSVGTLSSLSVGPNSSVILTGTAGFVKANSIQGIDGVNAIYPGYNSVAGAAGVTTNLTVGVGFSGNITANGNVTANYFIGNGSSLSSITGANVTGEVAYAATANLVWVGNVSGLGNIATLSLDGSASNVLYGNGVFAPAGGSYGDSNVATFLASYGSNTITTTGNVTVGNIIGNGQALTGLNGSNVTGQVGNALVAGTVYTNAQPNITSVGSLSSLFVTGTATFTALSTFYAARDRSSLITSATGTTTHDLNNGAVFYHYLPSGSFSPNFTNVDASENYSTVVVLFIQQGAAAIVPTSTVYINTSTTVTVKWLNALAPTGTASGYDMVSYSLIRILGGWVVLGQTASFS